MKVSGDIMDRNWITLADGCEHDSVHTIMARSTEMVEPGHVVIASGMIKVDVDIGSGYEYSVLLDEVTFSN